MAIVSNRKLRTDATDYVSALNGTTNVLTFESVGPCNGAAKYSAASSNKATSSYVEVANNAVFNVTTGSAEARIYGPTTTVGTIICKNNNSTGDNFFYELGRNSTNSKPCIYNGTTWLDAASVANDSRWHHVVFTSTSGAVKNYFDGGEPTTSTGNAFFRTGTSPLYIGFRNFDPKTTFIQYISNVFFYNHVLTNAEVKNRFLFVKGFI